MPENLTSLLFLLLFIAPGFLFERAYWRGLPRFYREPDIFQQTIVAIIASAFIHSLLFFVSVIPLTVAWPEFRGWLLDLLTPPVVAPSNPYPLADVLALTLYPILSLAVGWQGGLWWRRRSPPHSPWWATLVAETQARGQPPVRLRVRLRNNEQYVGNLARLFWIGSKETTYELTLRAILREDPNHPQARPTRLPGQTISILSSDILWLSRIEQPEDRPPE